MEQIEKAKLEQLLGVMYASTVNELEALVGNSSIDESRLNNRVGYRDAITTIADVLHVELKRI